MGKALLVVRLAVRDIRYRPAQALLLLLAIAAGAATLTLGLAIAGTTQHPYARTRAVTRGPDVVAAIFPNGSPNVSGPPATARPGSSGGPRVPGSARAHDLLRFEHARGVRAYSGPFPVTWTLLRTGRSVGSAEVEGRTSAPSSVDRPKLLQGTWVRPGQVVVEAAFADSLGLHIGDRLSLGGRSFLVAGTAVSAAIPDYPDVCSDATGCFMAGSISAYNPGLVWATEADAARIAKGTTSTPFAYFLNLKLTDPATASAFARRYDSAGPTAPHLLSWQRIRRGDAAVIVRVQQVLYFGGVMIALLAIASVAVLVGGRMAEQNRRVGLLKSVGGTPGLVAAVLLFEHVLIAVCAAAAGLVTGWLAAPLLDGPGAGLLGAASAPALSGSTIGLVLVLALGVAVAATFVPAIRAARQSTVAALEDSARAPRRRAALIRLSAHLPAPLLLGARLVARRPRRLLLSVFSVAVTTTALVIVLIWHATAGGFLGGRVTQATTIISVMLVILAAVNTVFIGWATALETRHPAALAQALGATPDQITAGLSAGQLLPALAGTLLGIAGGIITFLAPRNGGGPAMVVPVPGIAVLVVVTLVAVAVLTAIPARIGARRPVSDILQAESA